MGGPGLDDLAIYALTHWPYQPPVQEETMPTGRKNQPAEAKLSHEAITVLEQKIVTLVEPLTELEQATLYGYLNALGMTLTKAGEIRMRARAIS